MNVKRCVVFIKSKSANSQGARADRGDPSLCRGGWRRDCPPPALSAGRK